MVCGDKSSYCLIFITDSIYVLNYPNIPHKMYIFISKAKMNPYI